MPRLRPSRSLGGHPYLKATSSAVWPNPVHPHERAATFKHPWAIGYETNLPIWICHGIKKPFSAIWPEMKAYE